MIEEKDNRCILYCRVSSKEQEDRGYSLEAQEKLLRSHAFKKEFEIAKIFKISESASGHQIRKTFNEMLVFVKKRKINTILCEKIDRLTRNLKDGAVISDWVNDNDQRSVHFVKENFVVSRNTRAHENLVWDMKVAIARFYTNNLSEEVKKGQKAKIEAGWIPNGQKFGYISTGEKGHKTHIQDEKIAPYIKRIFELYNSGNYTVKRLVETMYAEGLRGKTGKVGHSTIHRLLGDPFYCGYILWNGEQYEGKHDPIISEQLFDEVQEKLRRPLKAGHYRKKFHTFKGLIRCENCGCLISWQTQKGHNYGSCRGFKPCTRKGYIKEENIDEILNEMMDKIRPNNKEVLDWINKALKESNKGKKDYSATTRESLTAELQKIENRFDKMYDDKLDGKISEDYYNKKFKLFGKQQKDIMSKLEKLNSRVKNYYEVGVEIHNLTFTAREKYNSRKATPDDRRTLIQRIFREMTINTDQKLNVEYTDSFAFLAEWMPKLNATSELLKNGSIYKKTGSLEPAHPVLLLR